MNINHQLCMKCEREYHKNELYWVNDNYGIPWKKVCENCIEEVTKDIRQNFYGDDLTHDELYGEDY